MRKKRVVQPRFFFFVALTLAIVAGLVVLLIKLKGKDRKTDASVIQSTPIATAPASATPTPAPDLPAGLKVTASSAAKPSVFGFTTQLQINHNDTDSFNRDPAISFPGPGKYSEVPGILTFGGNNYRNSFSYGTVEIDEQMLVRSWEQSVGGIGTWTGTGWTGQPLIIQWPAEIRALLGVAPEFKQKEDFTEVIYPAMDGKIYFFDLESGTKTRTPIDLGVVVKSTPCLDPRGWPILYVGQSIQSLNKSKLSVAYIHAINLVTNTEICQFGGHDYFSDREWQAYDSSPMIIDDTLIYGGENGVLYSCKLNTKFDPSTGDMELDPEHLCKYKYNGSGYSDKDAAGMRWLGIESSVSGFQDYAYFADNGGRLQCVNINTYKLEFVADLNEDADATVVIDERYPEKTIYLYGASQVKNGTLDGDYGYSYHRCFNGLTGDLIWEQKWVCSSGDDNSSGGTIATPQVGKGNCSDLVYYSMNLTALTGVSAVETAPESGEGETEGTEAGGKTSVSRPLGGRIIAYNKNNGEIVWSKESEKSDFWSSPVLVYKENGKGYLLQCDREGYIKMYDALTGSELASISLGSRIDSTPAVFNNCLVVGTRGKGGAGEAAKIVCIKIS